MYARNYSVFDFVNYKIPTTCPKIPTTNNARMITIGDTFFLSNHIHNSVSNNGIRPGIKEFKLSCNVVIFVGYKAIQEAYWESAVLIHSAPAGRLFQSM